MDSGRQGREGRRGVSLMSFGLFELRLNKIMKMGEGGGAE